MSHTRQNPYRVELLPGVNGTYTIKIYRGALAQEFLTKRAQIDVEGGIARVNISFFGDDLIRVVRSAIQATLGVREVEFDGKPPLSPQNIELALEDLDNNSFNMAVRRLEETRPFLNLFFQLRADGNRWRCNRRIRSAAIRQVLEEHLKRLGFKGITFPESSSRSGR